MKQFPLLALLTSSLAIISVVALQGQLYNGTEMEFGKNRVQYKEFLWQQYEFEKFNTYFYEGGKEIAAFISQIAQENINGIENKLDFVVQDKIQIVVYNTLTDFRQSNVGLNAGEEYNIGGTTKIVGSKVFVYFEGDYSQLLSNFREGIAEILINQLMYGGDWKDVLKNATLLKMPDWYVDGLVSYLANPDNITRENRVRDGVLSGKYEKFNLLTGRDAVDAGHSMWKFIGSKFGEAVIPNILYMSRISRNIDNGYLFVLGMSLKTLSQEYLLYYKDKYDRESKQKLDFTEAEIDFKKKDSRVYKQFKLSPDGGYIAFITNELGQYKIWLLRDGESKPKKICRGEHKIERIIDYSYPILDWHPSSQELAYITEKRGQLQLNLYNVESGKTTRRNIFNLDKVLAMDYSSDGNNLIFSGVKNGQSDLYLYHTIGNRQERLTNDVFDDLDPKFVRESSAILFVSNRLNDTLEVAETANIETLTKDIYLFKLNDRKILDRITETPDINEFQPAQYDSIRYTYLSDQGGYINRYLAIYDSTISRIDTTIHYRYFTRTQRLSNYKMNILEQDVNAKAKSFGMLVLKDKKYHFYKGNFRDDKLSETSDLFFEESIKEQSSEKQRANELAITTAPADTTSKQVDIYNYSFDDDSEMTYEKKVIRIDEFSSESGLEDDTTLVVRQSLPKARNYKVNFTTDQALSQLNNSYENNFYQNAYGANTLGPGLGGLFKLAISDLMEDYRIVGGFRIAGDFDNNEYLLSYENLARRLDKKLTFHRQAFKAAVGPFDFFKTHTHQLDYRMSWPFNEIVSARSTIILRNDRLVWSASDANSLNRPNQIFNQVGLKFELVFDNTLARGLNLYNGSRFKLWAEHYRDPEETSTDFSVVGGDFRHYHKLHRNIIFAGRFAASTSFGSRKLAYMVGGVDNWLNQKIEKVGFSSSEENYWYQAAATPLRGFYFNSRDGNSMAIANAEIRIPIIKYFSNEPIKSDFLENLQILTFGDIGSAWTGPHPYSEENSFNTQTFDGNPFTIRVKNQEEPVIAGYGVGVRTRLLGYFVRADWAWGIDNGVILPVVFYVSLNLDF